MLDIILFGTDEGAISKQLEALTAAESFQDKSVCIRIMDHTGSYNVKEEYNGVRGSVTYNDVSELSEPQAYNFALKESDGDRIMFITDDGIIPPNSLDAAMRSVTKRDIVSLTPYCMNEEKKEYVTTLSFKMTFDLKRRYNVDLKMFPERFHICFSAYIFNKVLFEDITFDESLPVDSDMKVLMKLLDEQGGYLLLDRPYNCGHPNERDFFNYPLQFEKCWYEESVDNFLIDAVKPDSSIFVNHFVLYLICCRFACNMNERDKSILSPDEAQMFFKKIGQALRYVDDITISSCHHLTGKGIIPRFFVLNLLRLKYNDYELMPEISATAAEISAHIGGSQIWSLGASKLEFKVLYHDGENLVMDGFYPGSYVFSEGDIEIFGVLDQSIEYPFVRTHIYALNKFFNVSAKGNYTFRFMIPEKELRRHKTFSFWLRYKGRNYPLAITLIRAETKLSMVKNSYWVCGRTILTLDTAMRCFVVEKLTRMAHFKHELKFIRSISRSTHGMWKIKMVGNRLLYWVTKPFYKKKIWLTMDKIFKAGDNGEYFYRYVKSRAPEGVKIYYVVQHDSPDYARLKAEFDTIVKFNSIKHKMLALHTDLMLATHVDTMNCNGYYAATQKYFKDLYNARVVCLAHGLTIQKIAQYQNRTFDNTVLYFFASKYEIRNVSHEVYDYYDKSMLCLTGHARYDGLKSNDKKIILITPTWRRGTTTGKAKKGSTYAHSSSFIHSDYYKIYNGLINDDRLINTAKEYGYKIVYLLHPAMSSQLVDFAKKDGVDIIAAAGDMSYEKILTESSLMVTDYSGVQFDFAYMKKPLVYYHPDVLPPQYEAGGLEYETMGFGPICRNHEQIVAELCDYIKTGCAMKDMYKERVDDFFEYSDHNNCERIYDEVMRFQSRFGKVNVDNYGKKRS